MAKIKIGDLSKQLKMPVKELLKVLKELGIEAKTSASSVDKEVADIAKDYIAEKVSDTGQSAPAKTTEAKADKRPKPVKEESEPKIEDHPAIETPPAPKLKEVSIRGPKVIVKDLAEKLCAKVGDIIKVLMIRGQMATINQAVDFSIAKEIAVGFGIDLILDIAKDDKAAPRAAFGSSSDLEHRPPVVTIMGHVDHGKTKLLDSIRKSNVIDTESGGITQHIGAYQVTVRGKKVTFLDTPGHAAFTALRARGAKVTDIAILIVAADEGVKPQTIEAYDHIKAAGVPIIVALNKIDKPEANIDRVKTQLSELGLTPEDWGGQTVTVQISAKMMKGIDELLEMILLVADMLDIKTPKKAKAEGVVIESKLDKQKGPLATVLVKQGVLRVGDIFVAGEESGKIKALFSDTGERVSKAPPSFPAVLLGFSGVPSPGETLKVVESEKEAKHIIEQRLADQTRHMKSRTITLEDFSKNIKEGKRKDLNLIIKADVQGSLEALTQALSKLIVSGIHLNLIHGAAGNITESDIMLAMASQAIVIGFHVSLEDGAKDLAESEGVDVRLYEIIYKVTEDIELAMEGLLEPEYEEVILGKVEVRNLFKYSKVGVIAGSFVLEGKIKRGGNIRIMRGGKKVYEGRLESLKRFKDDAKEVAAGYECGVAIPGYTNFQVGDIVEVFEMREKPRRRAASA